MRVRGGSVGKVVGVGGSGLGLGARTSDLEDIRVRGSKLGSRGGAKLGLELGLGLGLGP